MDVKWMQTSVSLLIMMKIVAIMFHLIFLRTPLKVESSIT